MVVEFNGNIEILRLYRMSRVCRLKSLVEIL